MPVRFGSGSGHLLWLEGRGTFSIRLSFDDLAERHDLSGFDGPTGLGQRYGSGAGVDPAIGEQSLAVPGDRPHFIAGDRPGAFVTVDRLLNHLQLYGLEPDGRTVEALPGFRELVRRTFGDAEMVGIAGPDRSRLLVVLPDGPMIEVGTELEHRAHRFGWGPRPGPGTSTMATARAIVSRCWSPQWGAGEEMLAQTLARCHLRHCGPRFSLSANSLCDWYLFDTDLATGLAPSELAGLGETLGRDVLGLSSRTK